MKRVVLIAGTFLSLVLVACSNKESAKENDADTSNIKTSGEATTEGSPLNQLVSAYLELKNALANDNKVEAAAAAKKINRELESLDKATLPADHRKIVDEVKVDIKEHADHISASSADIAHQREHFDLLSQDMIDLVRITGSSQTLYLDFCPMYNNKKGASWLSETREIRNPYYGKEMLECGELKEEFKMK